jgi:hypothetical protein
MRVSSVGTAAAVAAVAFTAVGAPAQTAPPLTNYGPEVGFFTPVAPRDLERGIVEAQRSMVPQPQPQPAPAITLIPQQPVVIQPAASNARPSVAVAPAAAGTPAAAAVPPTAPFVRIPDPTQGQAAAVNTHPLAQAAEARSTEVARAEEQMDRVERENERARQAAPATGVGAAFDGLTSERNR